MRLVGRKMRIFGIQGIRHKRRVTEVKLPDVTPTALARVQRMCAQGDSRLDFGLPKPEGHFLVGCGIWFTS